MARILIADQIAEQGVAMLGDDHEVTVQTGMSEDELVEAVADISALVVRSQTQVTARVIEAAPRLEVIGRAGVGVDNIELAAATARGVVVVNAPLANTMSATEHAFALMLAAARNVPRGDSTLREGRWERGRLQGVELAGHTLGVVGLGRIGSGVAIRARAFEMRVVAYDPFVSTERANSLGVELCSLEELLAESDFVTLHTALHEGTRGLIGVEQFKLMKPTAYLVNTARGALVDEQALYDAVTEGRLAGAAIDVFSEEPAIGNILTTSDRIVVTPHLAASTAEAQDRAAVDTVEQVLDVL
ncbi:MAG: phosphoglycerate dehydrogenase, partial [Chloroflexi bacterium]|nr:phosphoglycerate dehydrogenase [Chloroflexota bacterium]